MGNFRNKLILTFLFYGFLISAIAVGIIYKFYFTNLKMANIEKSLYKINNINEFLNYEINSMELQINSIRNSSIFKEYLKNKSKNNLIKELFLTIANSSDSIMQLRYIDNHGLEKIRVDRNSFAAPAYIVKEKALQNKFTRYYFQEAINFDKNSIWYSKIDLNKERGKIEKPIKPVLRIATPVYSNNQTDGILIINIFMKNILHDITKDPLYNIYVIDEEGNFLLHPNTHWNWSKYLNKNYSIKDAFKNNHTNILKNNLFRNEDLISKKLDFDNHEKLKVVIESKLYFVQSQLLEHSKELLITLFGVVLLSLPLAYLFSKQPSELKEQVDKFNETLEGRIKSRTRRLHIANEKLEKLATLDFLTEIPNRRYFFTMGTKLFHTAKRGKIDLSLVVLDIDFFKKVNDTYGHKVGDKVLIQIANTLNNSVRKEDIAARIGGEEFALVLNNVLLEDAIKISDKIRQKIVDTPYIDGSIHIELSASFGVTQYITEDIDLVMLYDRADKALYMAKEDGRNCVKSTSSNG